MHCTINLFVWINHLHTNILLFTGAYNDHAGYNQPSFEHIQTHTHTSTYYNGHAEQNQSFFPTIVSKQIILLGWDIDVFIDYLQETIPELKDLNEAQVRRAIKYDAVDRLEVCYTLFACFFSQKKNLKGTCGRSERG